VGTGFRADGTLPFGVESYTVPRAVYHADLQPDEAVRTR
jgi:hypothetical protein